MLKLFIGICVTGSLIGFGMHLIAVCVIQFIEYLRIRQCGLHICRFCDVKNKCSWKSEWEEIKKNRE